MNNKNILSISLLILAFAFLFSLTFVSATLITPANGATIAGTAAVLNASNATTLSQLRNCTFYALSADTANSSWANIGFVSNWSANQQSINTTFNTNTLEDAATYQFNASCYNWSSSFSDSVSTATIIIDNTAPDAPTSLTPTDRNIVTNTNSQAYSSTVINPNTTSCTFSIGLNGASFTTYTATYSASTCSYTDATRNAGTANNGDYSWYFTASDGTNTTSSSILVNQIRIPGASGGLPPGYDVKKTGNTLTVSSSKSNTLGDNKFLIIGAFIVVIFLIFYLRGKR